MLVAIWQRLLGLLRALLSIRRGFAFANYDQPTEQGNN